MSNPDPDPAAPATASAATATNRPEMNDIDDDDNNNNNVEYTTEELDTIRKDIKQYVDQKITTTITATVGTTPSMEEAGKRITAIIIQNAIEQKMPASLIEGYYQCPPYLFYTDKEHTVIRRVYGMTLINNNNNNNEIRAHVATAMTLMINIPIEGVPLNELVPVKTWPKNLHDRLTSGLIPDADSFLLPLGFAHFIYRANNC
jgi:hypothetical protein